MAKYRKRPVVVEVEQYNGTPVTGVYGCEGQEMCPCWKVGGAHGWPHVMTAHGQIIHVEPGDWIIAEPDGRGYYPCKDDIFRSTYQPVVRPWYRRVWTWLAALLRLPRAQAADVPAAVIDARRVTAG